LSNSFEALNDENLIIMEVATGSMATTSDSKLVLVDDDGKPLKKVDYPVDLDSDDEVEPLVGTMERESNVDDDYDPYNDDMYEGQEIHDNIQTICDNLDIKVCGRKKK
ncbi:hypothetical protein Tco_0288233, partial [Tanacetum coccineum]